MTRGTEWESILFPEDLDFEERRELEANSDKFMLCYAKAVVSEVLPTSAEEYLDLDDWKAAIKELAERKDLNKAIAPQKGNEK